jgi:hypothetical protein
LTTDQNSSQTKVTTIISTQQPTNGLDIVEEKVAVAL